MSLGDDGTRFPCQEFLFFLSDLVDFVQYLQSLGRRDLASNGLVSLLQPSGGDPMTGAQLAEDMNKKPDPFFLLVSHNQDIGRRRGLTSFGKMIGLAVAHPRWPPWRLGLIGVQLFGLAVDNLPTIVGIVDLLARLYELDVGLGDDSAVRLLQVNEDLLVVFAEDVFVLDRDGGFLVAHTELFVPGFPSLCTFSRDA